MYTQGVLCCGDAQSIHFVRPSRCRAAGSGATMGKIRSWKPAHTGRASSNTAKGGKQIRVSWDQRLQQRADRAAVLAAQHEVDETIRETKRAERAEREAREARKQENRERGLQYQVISDTKKIKKMSKKQLRLIKKVGCARQKLRSLPAVAQPAALLPPFRVRRAG